MIFNETSDESISFGRHVLFKQVNDSELFAPAPLSVLDDVKDFKTEFERDWIAQGKTVTHLAWHALKPEFRGAH